MQTEIISKSNAKINLGLKIINKRSDGFHNIESIFIEIDFHDIISLSPSNKFQLSCNHPSIPTDQRNTIYKIYHQLQKKYSFKNQYKIKLIKNIPIGSGLGGGSSNAACVLKTLNKIENLNLSQKELLNIAQSIGSDVPFFLDGKVQFVQGRGEILNKITYSELKKMFIILIMPSFKISTPWAYNKIKKYLHEPIDSDKFPGLNSNVDWQFFKNDFEEVVNAAYPEIFEIKEFLYNNGALYSGLSGSGSTMFGIYNDKELLSKVHSKLIKYKSIIVSPI